MDASETGKLIAAKRKEKRLIQKELAERLKVTDKAVSKWETGRGMPDVSVLEELSRELEISVSEILNGKEVERDMLPETADKIIVDTMKSSKRKVNKKRLMAIGAGVAAAVLMIFLLTFLYFLSQTMNPKDTESLEESINGYISFRHYEERAKILETRNEQGLLLVLYNHGGFNGIILYEESSVFPGRVQKNAMMVTQPEHSGRLGCSAYSYENKTVVMLWGEDLPEEARYYSVEFFGMEQFFEIENTEMLLDVYIYPGHDDTFHKKLLNKDKKPLYDDFGEKTEENRT